MACLFSLGGLDVRSSCLDGLFFFFFIILYVFPPFFYLGMGVRGLPSWIGIWHSKAIFLFTFLNNWNSSSFFCPPPKSPTTTTTLQTTRGAVSYPHPWGESDPSKSCESTNTAGVCLTGGRGWISRFFFTFLRLDASVPSPSVSPFTLREARATLLGFPLLICATLKSIFLKHLPSDCVFDDLIHQNSVIIITSSPLAPSQSCLVWCFPAALC